MSLRITAMGGGTGQPPVLVGMLKMFHDLDVELNAVVGTWDNGGSSGKLRDLYGVMPPGDILKNILALTPPDKRTISELLLRRYDRSFPKLYEHNAGNMLLTAFEKHMGILPAIRAIENIVDAQGKVYPVTLHNTDLKAEMTRVKAVTVSSEKEIEERLKSNYKISKLWLEPETKDLPGLDILKKTDVLIISPGSIFTSIIPHFTIKEIREECERIKFKIMIANLTDKHFNTDEYLKSMCIWSGINPDYIIFNSIKINNAKYGTDGYKQICIPQDVGTDKIKCISRPVMKMDDRLLRHDPKRTAAAITEILSKEHIL
jgi:uncharacterized cofD-like protein